MQCQLPLSLSTCFLLFQVFFASFPQSARKEREYICLVYTHTSSYVWREKLRKMEDWVAVVIVVVVFVLLMPGLLFQFLGNNRVFELANMQTSGKSIFVHTIIYFGLLTVFLIVIGVHIYAG
ncbi:uncharacterized protein LOC132303416 [Cornus florida]|uniref:uncharacterized protein LOC132303416 n=1 Tax=Cornus florida TaxID=4283 RepID=UPI00289FE251|nr:uncharacterized protein LOC132303416 [Cornus florida]